MVRYKPQLMATKYNNKKTYVEGIKFDSKKEAMRYKMLKIDPEVTDLKLQVKFPIIINGQKVCTYIADFTYFRGGEYVVEDSKGFVNSYYKIKRKLMKVVNNITILET